MGLLDFFRSSKKETDPTEKEKPFEGSWDPDALADDQRQAKEVAEQRYHVVQESESLAAIAQKYYGNADQWQVIYHANQDEIKNPDLLYPGQRLYIPATEE